MEPRRHSNWLDALRLLFAALVLLSHSSELIDGDRRREPLARLFSTVSFGELAVSGFFVISGYLIARAWTADPRPLIYLRNRLLRIAPAFAVAFLVSLLVVGAIGAAEPIVYLRGIDWRGALGDLLTLNDPASPGTFPGAPTPAVNGSMWTIRYEFGCYLLAPLLLSRRWLVAAGWIGACAYMIAMRADLNVVHTLQGRFAMLFLSGCAYQVFNMRADRLAMIGAAVALPFLLASADLWEVGLATAGAYLLLSLGLRASRWALPDVSYGVYLYGWPIEMLLIYKLGLRQPQPVFAASVALALICGATSWFFLERHALRLKHGAGRLRVREVEKIAPDRRGVDEGGVGHLHTARDIE